MTADIGLTFDPRTRRCDIGFAGADVAIDTTARTPLIVSIGCDRRAAPDDVLPSGVPDAQDARWNPRRGWPGDALDPAGERIGSRLWLIEREKHTEEVRLRAEDYLAEATAWLARRGLDVSSAAVWVRANMLGFVVRAGGRQLQFNRAVGG